MYKKKEISSNYSNFSMNDFQTLDFIIADKYGVALHDNTLPIEKRRLKNLIAKIFNDTKKREEEYNFISEFAKKYTIRQAEEFAKITYLAMKKNKKNWGLMGEDAITIGFCRAVCNIKLRDVTQSDIDNFNNIIDECDKRNHKIGDLQNYLRNFKFELFGKKYCHSDINNLNQIFYLMEMDFYFFAYLNNDYGIEFLVGEVSKMELGDDRAFIIKNEFRTPQFSLACAGKLFYNTMLIRMESIDIILYNKWINFYKKSKYKNKYALRHVYSLIREGLKSKTLEFYGVKNIFEFLRIKNTFKLDMVTGVFWHEVGHHVADSEMNPMHDAFRANFYDKGNLGSALGEAVADWAPTRGNRKGPFAYFVELSKKDILNATGNVYCYISDNWFVDEEDEDFLCSQSFILTALTYLYINSDGSVNFEEIERDNIKIYNFLQKQLKILIEKAIDIIRNASYDLGNRIIDYKTLESEIYDFYQHSENACSLEKLLNYSSYWKNVLLYLQIYSKEGWDKYIKLVAMENEIVQNMILDMAIKNSKKKYSSLRNFIIEKSKEISVIKEPPKINYEDAVEKICNELNILESEKVQEEFRKLIDGDIIIDVEEEDNEASEESKFIEVLQEMMKKTGYIESGMLIGNYFLPDAELEELKEIVLNELENLRDHIELNDIYEIEKLRVNKLYNIKYNIQSIVDEMLKKILVYEEEELALSIKYVEYTEFENDAIFEVFINLLRGYLDYNTKKAVRRINYDIRPNDIDMYCIIDSDFIKNLIEEYYYEK